MKNKIFILFIVLISIIVLYPSIKSNAASGSLDHAKGYRIYRAGYTYHLEWFWYEFDHWAYPDDPVSWDNASQFYYGVSSSANYSSSNLDDVINYANSNIATSPSNSWTNSNWCNAMYNNSNNPVVVIYNVPYRYTETLPDGQPEPGEPSWWENMWSELGDALGDPNFWFGEWFVDIIDNIFGNDEGGGPSEHSISTHVQIENPTLTPAPTPIPYTTVVIPKTDPVTGDTYYETNYYYNNPSGTPVIQPYPPTNPPATNSPSNGNDYIPIGGDPYSIPFVNWLTSTTIDDSNYDGIDSVSSGLDSIDSIGSEYNDGLGAVQDATGTLPTTWLLLIGIAAAIPLIAGIISRFLS